MYKNEVSVCIEIFFVRGSKMVGREHYFFDELKDITVTEEDLIVALPKSLFAVSPTFKVSSPPM